MTISEDSLVPIKANLVSPSDVATLDQYTEEMKTYAMWIFIAKQFVSG